MRDLSVFELIVHLTPWERNLAANLAPFTHKVAISTAAGGGIPAGVFQHIMKLDTPKPFAQLAFSDTI